jgi:outer membrane protein
MPTRSCQALTSVAGGQAWHATLAALLLAGLTLLATPARAQFDGEGRPATNTGMIGAAVFSSPRYMGADDNRLRALPYLSYHWANGWFIDGVYGLGYAWSPASGRRLGLHLGASPEREESDSAALRGMGDVDRQAELGGFAHQRLGRWLGGSLGVRSHLRYGAGDDHRGGLADLGLDWGIRLPPRSMVSLGLSATWANQDYMQTYFGVTPKQSAASGYEEHKTGSGLRDLRLRLGWIQIFSPTTMGLFMINQTYWQGDAADSPIVHDRRNTMVIAAVAYRF